MMGAKKGLKKPSLDEIQHAKVYNDHLTLKHNTQNSINPYCFTLILCHSLLPNAQLISLQEAPFNPSMFGTTVEEVLEMQEDIKPHLKIPWVVVILTETVLRLSGPQTEGIFR